MSALVALSLAAALQTSPADRAFARAVVGEVNAARTDPQAYAERLRRYRSHFDGRRVVRPGRQTVLTREGRSAVDEAIRHLERQRPVPALEPERRLDRAARDHVADQGPRGAMGHVGSDGSSVGERLGRYGGRPYGGENIQYGGDTPEDMVVNLIVDDGVPDRGHRTNIFREGYRTVGAACGDHAIYGYMCVIDFGY